MNEKIVDTRSELLSLLTEACELEHGLACSYLYAGFSLKQELSEGLNWEEQQVVRRWAAQLFFVASQEMLHLAQAWNLLTAIGGTPYHLKPNPPLSRHYYPLELPLELAPFSVETMERFVRFEAPLPPSMELPAGPGFRYRSVGELYELIRSGFTHIPPQELFIGAPEGQAPAALVHFPDIIRVIDRPSALRAISLITTQGEGTTSDRIDSHWGIFQQILDELRRRPELKPTRDVARNPAAWLRGDQDAQQVTEISHPFTRQAAELFDDVYGHMLRILASAFERPSDSHFANVLASASIELMVTCVKPLGEALMMLPVAPTGTQCAGPCFGISRHLPLPASPSVAWALATERLTELKSRTHKLLGSSEARGPAMTPVILSRLMRVEASLERIASGLRAQGGRAA